MAERPEPGTRSGGEPDEAPARTPRWVKVFAIVLGVALLLLVVVALIGGNHGPGRHGSMGDPAPAGLVGVWGGRG
ncbi:MAG TPA: hypothetical protein VGD67_00590 [Pseudonocardiaceae bacterium]